MYKTILLAVDVGDEGSWRVALPRAVELARLSKASLHLIAIVPDFGMSMLAQYVAEGVVQKLHADAQESLKKIVAQSNISSDVAISLTVAHGTIYRQIIDTAHEIQADLIIVGAHKPDLNDYLLGPNAAKVVRHSDISVLVVR